MVDKLDVAGVLRAYSEQVANNGNSTKKLRDLIRRLKAELDLRKIYQKSNGVMSNGVMSIDE